MKIELCKEHELCVDPDFDESIYLYIAKDEFIDEYNKNKEKAYADFNKLAAMYTRYAGFFAQFSMEEFEYFYEQMKKSYYKGLSLIYYSDGNDIDHLQLAVEFVRK